MRSHKTVTLSVTEAEYSAITEVCYKILFFRTISLFIGVIVEYNITVHVDIVGDIFLLENASVYQRTKHIDPRHHFICDYLEDRTEKTQFVFSEENLADTFTKNLSNGLF